MSNPNVGWLYYVDYFRETKSLKSMDFRFLDTQDKSPKQIDDEKKEAGALLKEKCGALSNLTLNQYATTAIALEGVQTFPLTTTYPGLLVGAGYEHEVHVEGEFKLGFFFDYTSGLPLIPASSIKGVIHSAFKIPELMDELLPGRQNDVRALELEIFEGVDLDKTKPEDYDDEKRKKWQYLPSPKKDVFHDAIIFIENNDTSKKFLAADFITPHKHAKERRLDQFADPRPLQFMKVLPEVKFLFQFDVKDSKIAGITREGKKDLFKNILLQLGIGAKTRTGYGWMRE